MHVSDDPIMVAALEEAKRLQATARVTTDERERARVIDRLIQQWQRLPYDLLPVHEILTDCAAMTAEVATSADVMTKLVTLTRTIARHWSTIPCAVHSNHARTLCQAATHIADAALRSEWIRELDESWRHRLADPAIASWTLAHAIAFHAQQSESLPVARSAYERVVELHAAFDHPSSELQYALVRAGGAVVRFESDSTRHDPILQRIGRAASAAGDYQPLAGNVYLVALVNSCVHRSSLHEREDLARRVTEFLAEIQATSEASSAYLAEVLASVMNLVETPKDARRIVQRLDDLAEAMAPDVEFDGIRVQVIRAAARIVPVKAERWELCDRVRALRATHPNLGLVGVEALVGVLEAVMACEWDLDSLESLYAEILALDDETGRVSRVVAIERVNALTHLVRASTDHVQTARWVLEPLSLLDRPGPDPEAFTDKMVDQTCCLMRNTLLELPSPSDRGALLVAMGPAAAGSSVAPLWMRIVIAMGAWHGWRSADDPELCQLHAQVLARARSADRGISNFDVPFLELLARQCEEAAAFEEKLGFLDGLVELGFDLSAAYRAAEPFVSTLALATGNDDEAKVFCRRIDSLFPDVERRAPWLTVRLTQGLACGVAVSVEPENRRRLIRRMVTAATRSSDPGVAVLVAMYLSMLAPLIAEDVSRAGESVELLEQMRSLRDFCTERRLEVEFHLATALLAVQERLPRDGRMAEFVEVLERLRAQALERRRPLIRYDGTEPAENELESVAAEVVFSADFHDPPPACVSGAARARWGELPVIEPRRIIDAPPAEATEVRALVLAARVGELDGMPIAHGPLVRFADTLQYLHERWAGSIPGLTSAMCVALGKAVTSLPPDDEATARELQTRIWEIIGASESAADAALVGSVALPAIAEELHRMVDLGSAVDTLDSDAIRALDPALFSLAAVLLARRLVHAGAGRELVRLADSATRYGPRLGDHQPMVRLNIAAELAAFLATRRTTDGPADRDVLKRLATHYHPNMLRNSKCDLAVVIGVRFAMHRARSALWFREWDQRLAGVAEATRARVESGAAAGSIEAAEDSMLLRACCAAAFEFEQLVARSPWWVRAVLSSNLSRGRSIRLYAHG